MMRFPVEGFTDFFEVGKDCSHACDEATRLWNFESFVLKNFRREL